MASLLKRTVWAPVPFLFSDRTGMDLTRRLSKGLTDEFCGHVTDKFVELLLGGMDLAFCLSKGYRKNIRDFSGRYLFRTADGLVGASATFQDGNMKIHENAIDDWDVRVTFKDTASLKAFLFSRDQDILNSILNNDVEVDGNLNHIYKFGFMVRDLGQRLGFG